MLPRGTRKIITSGVIAAASMNAMSAPVTAERRTRQLGSDFTLRRVAAECRNAILVLLPPPWNLLATSQATGGPAECAATCRMRQVAAAAEHQVR